MFGPPDWVRTRANGNGSFSGEAATFVLENEGEEAAEWIGFVIAEWFERNETESLVKVDCGGECVGRTGFQTETLVSPLTSDLDERFL